MRKDAKQYEFQTIIERLDNAIKYYKKVHRYSTKYRLFLTDGNKLDFGFNDENIAHLLGINIPNLVNSKILDSQYSFDLLEELIDRYTKVYNDIKNGKIRYNDIFSEYIEEKLDAFESICYLNFNSIKFVVHFLPSRAYISGTKSVYGCEYYLAIDNGNGKLVFLGLKGAKNYNNNIIYAPSSILGYSDENDYKDMLQNLLSDQVICLTNAMNIKIDNQYGYDDLHKLYLKPDEKLSRLRIMNKYKDKYGCIIDVSSDFAHNLDKLNDFYAKDNFTTDVLNKLAECIRKGHSIDKETIEKSKEFVDYNVIELLEDYNMSVKYSEKANISTEIEEISKLREELLKVKEEKDASDSRYKAKEILLAEKEKLIEIQEEELSHLRSLKNEVLILANKYQG